MRALRLLLVCAIVLASFPRRAGATAAGAESFDFLSLDAGARPVALGGAYTALADDSNALLYNPAGLGRVKRDEATFMRNEYFAGVSQDYVGLATRWGVGLNLNYVGYGATNRTTLSAPDGTLGTFGASDLAVGAGYGYNFFDTVSLGVAGKYIRENLDNVTASGYAFDVGALAPIPQVPRLTVGASMQNIGPNVRYLQQREMLPLNGRVGAAWGFTAGENENTITIDMMKERSMPAEFGVGAETVFAKSMAIRAGFNKRNDAGIGLTAGLGWTIGNMSVDYAIVPYGDLGLTHRISATLRWGKRPQEDYSRPRRDASSWKTSEDQDTPEAHFRRAEQHRKAGYYALAKKELEKASELMDAKDQRMVYYYEQLGYIAWLKKDVAVARDFYTEALKLAMTLGMREPVVADAYTGLAMCAAYDGDRAYALKVFNKALETNPSRRTKEFVERRIAEMSKGGD